MDQRRLEWQLRTIAGNDATLLTTASDTAQIVISRARRGSAFDIQLNAPGFVAVTAGRYVLTGRARSERTHTVSVGFSQAHEPWNNLGLYASLDLTTAWTPFELSFDATSDDENARIHFDVGGAQGSVEVSSVRLFHLVDGDRREVFQASEASRGRGDTRPAEKVIPTRSGTSGRRALSDARGSIVLMYHRVAGRIVDPWSLCVSTERFAQQMEVLRNHAQPEPLGAALDLRRTDRSRPAVAVTFDDGYVDNLQNARPLLERYEIPATVFVASGYVGGTEEFWWDELERLLLHPGSLPSSLHLTVGGEKREWTLGDTACYSVQDWRRYRCWRAPDDPPTPRQAVYLELWRLLHPLRRSEQHDIMSALRAWACSTPTARVTHRTVSQGELRTLSEGGLIEIGAHTETHSMLSRLPLADQRAEIESSKATLEQLVATPVASFSYPYGAFLPETIALVRDAGFSCACSTHASALAGAADPFQVPRVQVEDWAAEEFTERLCDWLG